MKLKYILLSLLLSITPLSALDFGVEWIASPVVEQIQGYKLYEKTVVNGQPVYTMVAQTAANVTEVNLANVTAGPHTYVVTAFNILGESVKSDELAIPALPSKVNGLKFKISNINVQIN